MFKTFLKIACRHIWRTKLYVCINISGLAIGMACVLLATIYMSDEQSFDYFELASKEIRWQTIFQSKLLGWFTIIFIINTLLSGAYPAYLLSGFNPVQVLYRKQQLTGRHFSGRVLVAFQFVTSIVLGIGSLVFYQQMHFIQSKNLGYNPDEVIKIDIDGLRDVHRIRENFESELKQRSHQTTIADRGLWNPGDESTGAFV